MLRDGSLLSSEYIQHPPSALSMARRSMSSQDYDSYKGVQMYGISYMSSGLRINGFLALPAVSAESYPCLIFNRGGAGEKGALTADSVFAYAGLYASWGYVVLASQYRGQGGSEGIEEWGARDTDDAMALLDLIGDLPYVDQDRIGLIGGSRGGMMALQMLTRTTKFRAAVTVGAPASLHDCPPHAHIYKTFSRFVGPEQDIPAELAARSASLWAHKICHTTPLLVLHGSGDRRVDPMHAYHLGLALQNAHHPYKLIVYENADHILAGRREESNIEIRAWVDRYVRSREPLPKTGPHGA